MAIPLIGTIFTSLGGVVKSFFGFKKHQADTIIKALDAIESMNISSSEKAKARAAVYVADSQSESMITRSWRPLLIYGCAIIIGLDHLGLVEFKGELSPFGERTYDFLEALCMVYIPSREIGKLMKAWNLPKIIETFVKKKFL